jgi:hypothetical protein
MISLSIDRGSLGLTPLTISDSGSGSLVLVSFSPGARQRDNVIAQSRWLDGGRLTSSRTEVVTLDAAIRINGSTISDIQTKADELDTALTQFGYTLTQTAGSLVTTYTCLPASTALPYDPVLLRAGTSIFTASIPRQP